MGGVRDPGQARTGAGAKGAPKVVTVIGFQRIVGPVLLGLATDESAITAALPDAELCVRELDRLLGDSAFLAGESFSIADAVLGAQMAFFAATPEGERFLNGSRLAAWFERVDARPSFKATLPPPIFRKAA